MNKKLKRILTKQLIPHLSIVLSGMLLVLLAIDRVNSAMVFIDHRITKGLMWVLCASSIFNAISLIARPVKPARKRSGGSASSSSKS